MRRPWAIGAVTAAMIAALPAVAAAQKAPYDPAVDVQLFAWAIGPKTFLSVTDADVADPKQLSFDAVLTFITNPLIVGKSDVVNQVSAAQLAAAYGITDRFQIGVALPIIFKLDGDAFDARTNAPGTGGLDVSGIGDLRIELKARLWRRGHVRVGGTIGGTIATSDGTQNSQFTGDETPSGRARLAIEWDHGPVTVAANVGAIVRASREIYGKAVGDDFVFGAAAAYRLTDRLSLVGEGIGETAFAATENPIELVAALRVYATPSASVIVGGGAGVTKALGSPESQFFLAFSYSPDVRDSDGDGIPNARDKCPLVPEDKDGFQDEDGCPDDDNDGDLHPDATDKCPNQAEDVDGFEDEDGCPDLDNDKDGIPDLDDKCPNQPEDGLPPFPHDGCPASARIPEDDSEKDSDGDGIPDATDKCPLCPEDKDGFQDEDGCPDLDNDNDGIPDAVDKCPNEPETINGVEDDDGCPDTGGLNVARLDEGQLVVDRVPTLEGAALSRAGVLIVNQMALVMAGHHDVTKWVVAVAQPSAGTAKQLAAAIRAQLVKRGVTAEITMLDKAGPSKVAGVVQERLDPAAPFVCPEAAKKPEASAGSGAPP